jgi:hypothetical protein
MIVAPPTVVNAIEDALAPFGVRIYEQHLPPARILELIAAAGSQPESVVVAQHPHRHPAVPGEVSNGQHGASEPTA